MGPVVQLVKTSPSQFDGNGGDPRFEPGRAHHYLGEFRGFDNYL